MVHVRTEIDIEAPVSRVWSILTDFQSYPEWNPLVSKVWGKPGFKEWLAIRLETPLPLPLVLPVRIHTFVPNKEFSWLGEFPLLSFLVSGDHYFHLEARSESKTRFVHGERFDGLLVDQVETVLEAQARPLYEAMNRALQKRAED